MAEKIIEFDKVVAGYSPSLTILNETTLDARKGEITLLIGPNGAGKSTVLKTLFGMLVRARAVRFEGKVTTARGRGPAREGIASCRRTQPVRLAWCGTISSSAASRCRVPSCRPASTEALQRFPRIRERIDNQASTMSGGEQKQLEISRALLCARACC
jgi:branched-chain amino acid transport system ATP-binding protein